MMSSGVHHNNVCDVQYAIHMSLGATVFVQYVFRAIFPLATLLILFLFGIFNVTFPNILAPPFSAFSIRFFDLFFPS